MSGGRRGSWSPRRDARPGVDGGKQSARHRKDVAVTLAERSGRDRAASRVAWRNGGGGPNLSWHPSTCRSRRSPWPSAIRRLRARRHPLGRLRLGDLELLGAAAGRASHRDLDALPRHGVGRLLPGKERPHAATADGAGPGDHDGHAGSLLCPIVSGSYGASSEPAGRLVPHPYISSR